MSTDAQPEPTDPTQCSGDEGFCPEHGFHRHSLKQPGGDHACIHPDGYEGECPCPPSCACCRVTAATEPDTCRPVEIDGETIRVRGSGELTEQGQEALTALVRAAKAKFIAEAPDQVGVLQNRLRLAHQARRAKEHQLDGIRRALCDVGAMQDDDHYSHADLEDVIRQAFTPPAASHDDGPSVREAAANDRRWWGGEKTGD